MGEDAMLKSAANAAILGFRDGIKQARLDKNSYEINQALLLALESDAYETEWRKGKKAFPKNAEAKK